MNNTSVSLIVLALLALSLHWAWRRLQLSRAKHRSLAGHARWSRRLAALVPFYEYDELEFFRSDGAPDAIAQQRQAAFRQLAGRHQERYALTLRATAGVAAGLSDLQFTSRYRVPFQFSALVRRQLPAPAFMQASKGATLTDLDGNELYDVTGSYGLNVFGYDFYKGCIERGLQHVRELGPVLGVYHPILIYNVRRLQEISGLPEVSFHMSGTEAVMQAVRLARYHTRRTHLVRFCGAYHGWWGDVQPGVGNPSPAHETYTLEEMNEATLHVLRTRRDIACVLVNPLQALHPNAQAPADSALLDSSRTAHFDRERYGNWLQALREVCTRRGIVLIFDEVFVGFRLALGGAQEYFGVRADMVTYGKTLGGGLPVGVLCGQHELMQRFRETHPADICFARGTFNSHPYVMGAMHEFLLALETPQMRAKYVGLDALWNRRAAALNQRLHAAGLPVRIANLSSIWTLSYTQPARYNWMLQYYLRAEGVMLSWVGTGRLIFSIDLSDADFAAIAQRILAAAATMHRDGWWWSGAELSNRAIRRRVLRELLRSRRRALPWDRSARPATDATAPSNRA